MAAPMQTLIQGSLKKVPGQTVTSLRLLQETPSHILTAKACSARCLHTSFSYHKDRRKDRAVAQYLYHKDHEKTMRHRNLALLDLPDYSYTDGRPTELSFSQTRRQERNYELAKQIVQYIGEMKQAQNLHQEEQENVARRQRERLDSRLTHKQTPFTE